MHGLKEKRYSIIRNEVNDCMRMSNETVCAVFQENMDRYYVPYSDLLSHRQYDDGEQVYFAQDEAAFVLGRWICVTVNEAEVLLEIEGDTTALDEAIAYAKTKEKPLLLRLDSETAEHLFTQYPLCRQDGSGYAHQGVFGVAKECKDLTDTRVMVRHATEEDVAYISALSVSQWGNLPVIIRFTKNVDSILLAERDGEMAGYLIYASSAFGYYDIVSVMTHSSKRGKGIGKTLVDKFMKIAFAAGCVPYYGEAKTAASAALARTMGFEQLTPTKAVYTLQ